MAAFELSGKQRRFLRGLGNRLRATVFIGHKGINEAVIHSTEKAFSNSELLKIKLQESFPDDRQQAAAELAKATNAHVVQVLGRTILLYRRDHKEPKIDLP